MSKFEAKALRNVFGQFPTGVTVITTRDVNGDPIGMTASSFNTVSIDPALILWSIDKSNFSLEAFKNCEYFAVNILTDQQIEVSNRFAGRGQDKFAGLTFDTGAGDCPLLPDALAQLECKNWNVVEGGDHLVVIGEVVAYKLTDNAKPLAFSQGSYAQVTPHYQSFAKKETDAFARNEFLDDHLLYLLRDVYNQLSKDLYHRFNEQANVTPEMWRVFACLADGKPLLIDELSNFVMQPKDRLLDIFSSIGEEKLTYDGTQAILTDSGVALAQDLLQIAESYKQELSARVEGNNYEQMKDTLRSLSDR